MEPESLGNVVEFELGDGALGYAIATAFNDNYGHVLHVLRGKHPVRPKALEFLVNATVLAVVFFPLNALRRKKIVRVIGRIELRGRIPWHPVFRTQLNLPIGDEWSLWDGNSQVFVGPLSIDKRNTYPLLRVVNDRFVVHVIETEVLPSMPELPS